MTVLKLASLGPQGVPVEYRRPEVPNRPNLADKAIWLGLDFYFLIKKLPVCKYQILPPNQAFWLPWARF